MNIVIVTVRVFSPLIRNYRIIIKSITFTWTDCIMNNGNDSHMFMNHVRVSSRKYKFILTPKIYRLRII